MVDHMTEDQKEIFIREHCSMDEFQNYFLESASSDSAQKNFQKVSEWYGSKRNAMNAVTNPASTELFSTYQKRLGSVLEKLAAKKDCDVQSFEVKELVNEYDFVSKQLYQMDDLTQMMLEMAQFYLTDRQMQDATDKVYGEGTSEFFGLAFRAFYSKE